KTDLCQKLDAYIGNEKKIEGLSEGQGNKKSSLKNNEDSQTLLQTWISTKDLAKLGEFWIQGGEVNWRLLYQDEHLQKVSLPTYPFAREYHWITELYDDPIWSDPDKNSTTNVYYYQPEWKQKALEEKEHPIRESILELNATNFTSKLHELGEQKALPNYIIYRMSLPEAAPLKDGVIKEQLQKSFYELLNLSQTLIQLKPKETIDILCVHKGKSPFAEALSGFAKSLHLEYPKLNCKIIEVEEGIDEALLMQEFNAKDIEVYYDHDGTRWVKEYEDVINTTVPNANLILKQKGVYLISGGAGGLGLIFARYLAEHYKAKLILTGRSAESQKQKDMLTELEKLGGEAIYIQADVTDAHNLNTVMQTIKDSFGPLQGVIHSAGVVRDAFILKKTQQEAEEVLAPKILGAVHLDEITQSEPLDFFVMFSSISGAFGNIGQSDYAYANAWMDAFATYRDNQRKENKRSGNTISINWPLWAEGGMNVDEATKQRLKDTLGAEPLTTQEGINAFIHVLRHVDTQMSVLFGLKQKLVPNEFSKLKESHSVKIEAKDQQSQIETEILTLFSNELKIKKENLDVETSLDEYGLDSIMMMNLLNKVEESYGLNLSPTAFVEHVTIRDFVSYLLDSGLSSNIEPLAASEVNTESVELNLSKSKNRFTQSTHQSHPIITDNTRIAVIGMAGRFPGSPNLETFWNNLTEGKELNCKPFFS
ncbi:MAG: SDR family NAD(P)-dependent oxidoreductase, partial [Gammaproteobacteria bacterium]